MVPSPAIISKKTVPKRSTSENTPGKLVTFSVDASISPKDSKYDPPVFDDDGLLVSVHLTGFYISTFCILNFF